MEKKITKALPKMAKGASSKDVAAAFEKHLQETEGQVERLEQIFELLGKPARGTTCPAIDGILEEGSEILEDYKDTVAIDAGLVAAAQSVEHYEIARYGTLCVWAEQLGMSEAVALLKATLAEEEATDEALSSLGEGGVNKRAMAEPLSPPVDSRSQITARAAGPSRDPGGKGAGVTVAALHQTASRQRASGLPRLGIRR